MAHSTALLQLLLYCSLIERDILPFIWPQQKYELISLRKIKYWNQLYIEVKSTESITR